MIVQLELTRTTVFSLVFVFCLAVLGAIHLHQMATRKRCACALCVGEFQFIQELGFGGFGRVFLVRERASDQVFVMKKILAGDLNAANNAQREAKKLRMLSHPLVVAYEVDFLHVEELAASRVVLDPQIYVCIVMEYCSNGDLKSYMEKQREGEYYLEADQVCRWMHQISAALSYCHAMGVVHRDVKAHNVFLSANFEIRLGDFGLSRALNSHSAVHSNFSTTSTIEYDGSSSPPPSPNKLRHRHFAAKPKVQGSPNRPLSFQSFTTAGTDVYRAPELFSGDSTGSGHDYKKIDIWCCGLLLVELLTLQFTWERSGLVGARALGEGIGFLVEEIPSGFPKTILRVCQQLLDVNPSTRLSAAALKSALEKLFPELMQADYK